MITLSVRFGCLGICELICLSDYFQKVSLSVYLLLKCFCGSACLFVCFSVGHFSRGYVENEANSRCSQSATPPVT